MPVTFEKEADMLEPTIEYFKERLPGWQHFTELVVPYGFADIVFARIDQELLEKRIRSKIVPDPTRMHYVRRFKVGEWMDCNEARSWVSLAATRLNLNILAQEGFLLRKKAGRKYIYSLNPDLVDPVQELVAVELKLSDYKKVHEQAHLRRYFANKSYAVLALDGKVCDKVIEHFRKYTPGVGLLFAKPQIELVMEYQANGWIPTEYPYANEEILRRTGVIPCLTNQDIDTQENKFVTNASDTFVNGNACSATFGLPGTVNTISLMGTLFDDLPDPRK